MSDRLADFGMAILHEYYRIGDCSSETIQRLALGCGVLQPVLATEPCGDGCICARLKILPHRCFAWPDDIRARIDAAVAEGSIPITRDDTEHVALRRIV